MLALFILILLTVLLFSSMTRILSRDTVRVKEELRSMKNEHIRLQQISAEVKSENALLQETLDQTVAIYELTKQICKSLDEERVFSNFREQIDKNITLDDCRFIKNESELEQCKGYTVQPLEINHKIIGYLAVLGVKQKQKDKFYILSQQFMLGIKRALLYQKVQELAITDGLTGVFTRRHYMERCNEEIERSRKFHYSATFLMADIDHFKEINDHYGHLVGDAVLREVAKTIKENIRQVDAAGRYGGEEFIIILTETDKNGARFAAERIRQAIEDKHIKVYDEDLRTTISIGIATFPEDSQELSALIDKADNALYRAKQTGRNRVCLFGVNL